MNTSGNIPGMIKVDIAEPVLKVYLEPAFFIERLDLCGSMRYTSVRPALICRTERVRMFHREKWYFIGKATVWDVWG